jgi:hypothetical protein
MANNYYKLTNQPGSYKFYEDNKSRIEGIARANNVDTSVARDMFISNITQGTNYSGGGVANMGQLAKAYQSALNQDRTASKPATSYYDSYLEQQQQLIRQQEEAARKAEQERINQAVSANNAYIPQVQEQSNKQLQEAYLSYMKSKKNAPQTLAALGYTGGATESTLMGLDTGYQGVRGDLETARNQSLDQIRQNEQQIRSTGNANLSDLASQYYGQYAQASQNALNMAREQENLERQLSAQQNDDVMNKAKLAAQYGDYSLLQQLGINPQQQRYQQSAQTQQTNAQGISYNDNDVASKPYSVQLLINDLINGHQKGQISDVEFISQMNSLGIRTDYI